MLTEVVACEAPVLTRERPTGPTQPMDSRILSVLADAPAGLELRGVTGAVGGTTHQVHSRVKTLMDRGLVHRRAIPNGPRRGPGASVYVLTEAGSWTCPS